MLPNSLLIPTILSAMTLGQCLISAHLLIARTRHLSIYLPLGLFFLVNVVPLTSTILDTSLSSNAAPYWKNSITVISIPFDLVLAPLFYLYVRGLTSENQTNWQSSDCWHFSPAVIALFIPLLAFTMPASELIGVFGNSERNSNSQLILFITIIVLHIAWVIQCSVYVVLIIKRLTLYRARLMDLFASTTHLELRWIGWLGIFLAFYILFLIAATLIDIFSKLNYSYEPWDSVLDLLLIWTLSVWGLRQKPGLAEEVAATLGTSPKMAKYEKSSLPDDLADRIAAKIEAAMQTDYLYRDPNLSLRVLSKHIGEVPNYVSQTLNTKLGETFFDYVNKSRVCEAMQKLEHDKSTVLAIALDVGFNSRSSFYTAFKRVVGKTPTTYRKDCFIA